MIRTNNLIVRPQRVILLGLGIFYYLARKTKAITIKGKCPECGVVFELPQRVDAPFRVKCPNGHKISRLRAILTYIKSAKRGGK